MTDVWNHISMQDKNFLKVHPDLAALYLEIEEKEKSIQQLNKKKKALKEQVKAAKSELEKRLKVLEAWQMKGETAKNDASKKIQNSR